MTSDDVVTFSIKTDGASIPDDLLITAIEVNGQADGTATAEITIEGDRAYIDGFTRHVFDAFPWEKDIVIALGYHADNKDVFHGKIVKTRLQHRPQYHPTLRVICHGQAQGSSVDVPVSYGDNILDLDATRSADAYNGSVLANGVAAGPKATIKLKELGSLFTGASSVVSVDHEVKGGSWVTRIWFSQS